MFIVFLFQSYPVAIQACALSSYLITSTLRKVTAIALRINTPRNVKSFQLVKSLFSIPLTVGAGYRQILRHQSMVFWRISQRCSENRLSTFPGIFILRSSQSVLYISLWLKKYILYL
jgi:hypothetical protein